MNLKKLLHCVYLTLVTLLAYVQNDFIYLSSLSQVLSTLLKFLSHGCTLVIDCVKGIEITKMLNGFSSSIFHTYLFDVAKQVLIKEKSLNILVIKYCAIFH